MNAAVPIARQRQAVEREIAWRRNSVQLYEETNGWGSKDLRAAALEELATWEGIGRTMELLDGTLRTTAPNLRRDVARQLRLSCGYPPESVAVTAATGSNGAGA
jgi:hypothetical protein